MKNERSVLKVNTMTSTGIYANNGKSKMPLPKILLSNGITLLRNTFTECI